MALIIQKLRREVQNKIKQLFNWEQLTMKDYTYLSNSRQISLAKKPYKNLLDAEEGIKNSYGANIGKVYFYSGLGSIESKAKAIKAKVR